MTFLRYLQNTKLSELALLDLAYIVVLLPLIIMIKIPMLLFVLTVFVILIFKKSPANKSMLFYVFILGVVSLYFSLYGAFSFAGLSRLRLFLELLIYLLIIVVAMQRLKRVINFYLLVSSFLFLALSLFFYHSLLMLVYVIFEVFVLLWMILSHRMQGDIVEGFKGSMIMFMYSLPWVVVLFIFFPRISFEHADYGFKGELTKRMGHDGTMYLDGNALLVPSKRIVMEVGFDGKVPPSSQLYFRGSILYVDKRDHWEPIGKSIKRENKIHYLTNRKPISYKVTLYPTQKKWLYLLDIPSQKVEKSNLDGDLISTVEKDIDEPIHYKAQSYLDSNYSDTLDETTYRASTTYDATQNPKSYAVAKSIMSKYNSSSKRAKAVVDFFKKSSLTYTLKPDALDINHTTDSFLFDKKRGYCVHFASSFASMARMVGIPSRVVTGYKSDRDDTLGNYLAVRERDAHAWVELYISKRWIRYETTNTASKIDTSGYGDLNFIQKISKQNKFLKKLNLYLMYGKYQMETWILYYSHTKQLILFEYAKKNPQIILAFILSLMALIFLSFSVVSYLRRINYNSEALTAIQPLLKSLKKQGYERQNSESMHQFFLRYAEEQTNHNAIKAIKEIDVCYEKISYGKNYSKRDLKTLKTFVKKTLKRL